MSNLHLVTVFAGKTSKALYKNGLFIQASDYSTGVSNSDIDKLSENLSIIDDVQCQSVDVEVNKLGWTWDDLTIDLIEQGKLGEFNMNPFNEWKLKFLNGTTASPYPLWLKRWEYKQKEIAEVNEIKSAMSRVFNKEDLDRLENEEDPDAYDISICFYAHQRLTYFVDITVPGSCSEDNAEEIASNINIDGSLYEIDEEYWEEMTPYIEM